jgi:hypothetical protein
MSALNVCSDVIRTFQTGSQHVKNCIHALTCADSHADIYADLTVDLMCTEN